MTTEDRIPRELRERMDALTVGYNDHERLKFNRGVIVTLEYFVEELGRLMTSMNNAKPNLLDGPQTVRR